MEPQTFAENLLFTTVRVQTNGPRGQGTGTSFIFLDQSRDQPLLFLVTNKHVVQDADRGTLVFTQAQKNLPLIGQPRTVTVDGFNNHWHGHPRPEIDVTIMPLDQLLARFESMGSSVYFKAISSEMIPTDDNNSDLDAIEEVLFIGYPNGILDEVNLSPITRRGITATPIHLDYQGEPTFLMDASVFPGSSGSPVLISNTLPYVTRNGTMTLGNPRRHLLGIVAKVMIRQEHGQVHFAPIPTSIQPTYTTTQMIDLGVVFKASTIMETIDDFLIRTGRIAHQSF